MGLLEGKKAVILGAASPGNMGQVTARLFAAEGAEVLVAGRHEGPLSELASELGGHFALCDITSHAEVHALAYLARDLMSHLGDPGREVEVLPAPEPITLDNLPEGVGMSRLVRWVVGPTRPWCWLRAKQKDRSHPGRCLRPSEPAQRPRVGFPSEAV